MKTQKSLKTNPDAKPGISTATAARLHVSGPAAARYLDKQETSKLLGIGVRTLDVWMARRLIPWLKIGRTVRFSARDIDEYLQTRCRVAGR